MPVDGPRPMRKELMNSGLVVCPDLVYEIFHVEPHNGRPVCLT
jgi:hypothetical protein